MATRVKQDRKRHSLSVPSAPAHRQLSVSRQHSSDICDIEPVTTRRSRDSKRRNSSEQSETKQSQKTRTISVPVGLKEILNELSKEVDKKLKII